MSRVVSEGAGGAAAPAAPAPKADEEDEDEEAPYEGGSALQPCSPVSQDAIAAEFLDSTKKLLFLNCQVPNLSSLTRSRAQPGWVLDHRAREGLPAFSSARAPEQRRETGGHCELDRT